MLMRLAYGGLRCRYHCHYYRIDFLQVGHVVWIYLHYCWTFFYWKCIYPIIVFVSMSSNLSISTRIAYYHWITIDTKEICLCLFLGITKTLFLEWFILLSFLHILRIVHTNIHKHTQDCRKAIYIGIPTFLA